MTYFIGIDLGTTNSAISLYDGKSTRILKSPEQNDVTPSALFFDRRGNKFAGTAAYNYAPRSPGNCALLFKRLMGTSTPIELTALKKTMTPVECSAEILKVLYGYLPEEVRNSPDTGTVITVPAAFNQMQKDATMEAASMAGLGKVALMQEPVAAVMSVMSKRDKDGLFLIYDLGGGTLDIAIAESIGGRVNLLAHGGIAMCGGRDIDRAIVDNIVRPWLLANFNLPADYSVNKQFQKLNRMLPWAVERAKIELSAKESSVVTLGETEINMMDLDGNEIYLDIPISRNDLDRLIEEQIKDSIEAARETITSAGITAMDLSDVVFVGGPTNYKPLRDKVAFELGINANTDVNPMTSVAEGASIFAESIDWSKEDRGRKGSRGSISTGGSIDLGFNYIARTPERRARIVVQLKGQADAGAEFQIDSLDTGWTSGRIPLKHGEGLHVDLPQQGENTFKVFVFDPAGGSITIKNDRIVITRTAATIDAIPASHSLGIEVLDKIGGQPILDYLIRAGDSLPKKGTKMFKATESLKAGAVKSLNFKIWEGEIDSPISDNRMIGCLKISGTDFDDGIIPAGADLECTYEVLDSGNIKLEVSIPAIGGTFGEGKNFYSRQEGQINFADANAKIKADAEETLERLDQMSERVTSPKINRVYTKERGTRTSSNG